MVNSLQSAMDFLLNRTDYETLPSADFPYADLKLERMATLLHALGDPQTIPAVHIAGTKGKGSTATMISAVLSAAGYRTGLFTSPHLEAFEERIRIDGDPIPQGDLTRTVRELERVVGQIRRHSPEFNPTFFELTTALGWLWFREQKVDLVVLEVGLGGRLDSTNLCHPLVTAITSIGRDHTKQLGETLPEIAREKAGIFKATVPAISGVQQPEAIEVVRKRAFELRCPLWEYGVDLHSVTQHSAKQHSVGNPTHWRVSSSHFESLCVDLALRGDHQGRNLALVVGVAERLRERGYTIPPAAFVALSQTVVPARQEILSETPLVLLDSSHNEDSIRALVDTLQKPPFASRAKTLLFGCLRDKQPEKLLKLLEPCFARIVLTTASQTDRALPVEELARTISASESGKIEAVSRCQAALEAAWPTRDECLIVTGSFYLAGELRPIILERIAQKNRPSAIA